MLSRDHNILWLPESNGYPTGRILPRFMTAHVRHTGSRGEIVAVGWRVVIQSRPTGDDGGSPDLTLVSTALSARFPADQERVD